MKKVLALVIALVLMFSIYALADIPHPIGSISGGVPSNGAPGGDYLNTTVTQNLVGGSAATYVIPIGTWFVNTDSGAIIEINRGTAASPTWITYATASTSSFLFSDGVSIRINPSLVKNTSTTSTTYLIKMK